ncbi:hypothetical protein PCE1_002505 [Barthelona sp. PCE]
MSPLETLIGPSLQDANHVNHPTSSILKNAKAIALYFSSSSCPPCRQFSHQILAPYLPNKDSEFEVVLVPFDWSAKDSQAYMKEVGMELAIPYHSELKQTLMEKYHVRGIPTVVVLDSQGTTLSQNARMEMMNDISGSVARYVGK